MTTQRAAVNVPTGWAGRLALRFTPGRTHTCLRREAGFGPLYVQKPFYPEGDVCHVYLLHPPGGIAGGDDLSVQISVDPDANTLITTPAATKFYRSEEQPATLNQTLSVADRGALEWLPGETIFFGGTRAAMRTRIELAEGARFIGWDAMCLGRSASGDHYDHGEAVSRLCVSRDGRPILNERLALIAGDRVIDAPWGLAGRRALATLFAHPADADTLRLLRAELAAQTDPGSPLPMGAATLVDGLLVCRLLGTEAEDVRQRLVRAWQVLRPLIIGRTPSAPRIWNT